MLTGCVRMSKEEGRKEQKRVRKHDRHGKDGHSGLNGIVQNGVSEPSSVVSPEMCCFCFDVLISHLTTSQTPRNPYFVNDEL